MEYRGDTTVCGVVHRYKQYSYLWDDIPDVVKREELHTFFDLERMAYSMLVDYLNGSLPPFDLGECDGVGTHYHVVGTHASWSDSMDRVCGTIGNHIFYEGN